MSTDIWWPELHDSSWMLKEGRYLNCDMWILSSFLVIFSSFWAVFSYYKMDDINTKVGICLKLFWKSEDFWWEMWEFVIWMNGSDRKSEYIFRDKCCWWKMLAFVFYLVFKMVVPLSTQLPSSPCSFYTLVWNKVSSSWKFSLSIFRLYCLITKYSRAALVPGLRSGVNGVLRKLF